MQRTNSHRILGTATLALSLFATGAVRPILAQSPPANAPGATTGVQTQIEDEDGEGFDPGLLGLLGLAGLLGLRRREATITRVDTTTRPRA